MAGNQLVIDFEHENKSLRAVLTATTMEVFSEAAKDARIRSLTGSEQVEAIIQFAAGRLLEVEVSAADGSVRNINRYKNGKLNDGPNQEPAEVYIVDGNLLIQRRYQNGELHDSDSGSAAVQTYFNNGQIKSKERYQNGLEQDAANGEPAFQSYYEDGSIERVLYASNGKTNDGINGEPAIRGYYPNGSLEVAIRYKNGLPDNGANGGLAVLTFDASGNLTRAESYNSGVLQRIYRGDDLGEPEVVRAAQDTFSKAVFTKRPMPKSPSPN